MDKKDDFQKYLEKQLEDPEFREEWEKQQKEELIEKFGKGMADILEEMCRRVNAPLSVVDSSPYWFQEYSWTLEEEDDFMRWLIKYFKEHKKEFHLSSARPEELEAALSFVFMYGWKIRQEDKE